MHILVRDLAADKGCALRSQGAAAEQQRPTEVGAAIEEGAIVREELAAIHGKRAQEQQPEQAEPRRARVHTQHRRVAAATGSQRCAGRAHQVDFRGANACVQLERGAVERVLAGTEMDHRRQASEGVGLQGHERTG